VQKISTTYGFRLDIATGDVRVNLSKATEVITGPSIQEGKRFSQIKSQEEAVQFSYAYSSQGLAGKKRRRRCIDQLAKMEVYIRALHDEDNGKVDFSRASSILNRRVARDSAQPNNNSTPSPSETRTRCYTSNYVKFILAKYF
jgi:hypothetical protein